MTNGKYDRQTILKEIGQEGQEKLGKAKVLIVGVGGLGSASSIYLAGAGVGTLGLVDFDSVSETNLQRQVLYSEEETGMPKTECAARRLAGINSSIRINTYSEALDSENAEKIISGYDIVVDGCDNLTARFIINDVCRKKNIPYIFGAISEFGGQVAVLCTKGGKNLRDLFGIMPASDKNKSNGVLGTTPGIIGTVQALQTIQLICNFGKPLVDRLWIIDTLSMETATISI